LFFGEPDGYCYFNHIENIEEILVILHIARLGKMGHLTKIGQICYSLDGSNGENFELSTKNVEIKHQNVAMGGKE